MERSLESLNCSIRFQSHIDPKGHPVVYNYNVQDFAGNCLYRHGVWLRPLGLLSTAAPNLVLFISHLEGFVFFYPGNDSQAGLTSNDVLITGYKQLLDRY